MYQTDGQKLLAGLGAPANIRTAEIPSTELIRQMVACGAGIAYVPEITISQLPHAVELNLQLLRLRNRMRHIQLFRRGISSCVNRNRYNF